MSGLGHFAYLPGARHRCRPPDTGGSGAPSHLPIGTVWKCLDHDARRGETCGKRWRVAYLDDAMGGDLGWLRRRLPWRPIFGVEHPAKATTDGAAS